MARIIESLSCKRRTIQLKTDDILSVVREYQRIIARNSNYAETRNMLDNIIIYLPEDI